MATTCFGPPPLPPNKRSNSASLSKDAVQRKNSFTQANNNVRANNNLTSSTYMSFKDPLDEILLISSEDLPPPEAKSGSKKCHHHHKRKNSLKKCKHALNLSISKFTEDKNAKKNTTSADVSFKSSALVNGFDRSFVNSENSELDRARSELSKQYFLHSPDEPSDFIPLKTFSEVFSKGYEDLTAVEDDNRNIGNINYATVRNNPFSRQNSVGRASFHTNSLTRKSFRAFGETKLSLVRSSSEGNLVNLDKEIPLSLTPLGSRRAYLSQQNSHNSANTALNKCLRVLNGSWRNLLQLGGMSRGGKPVQAKRVAPPAVPDAFCPSSPGPGSPNPAHNPPGGGPTPPGLALLQGPQHRLSGSSFGSSQGYASSEDANFMQAPDTPVASIRDDHSDYGSTVSGASGGSGKSPGVGVGGGGAQAAFTFPPPPQPLTHKAAVYYHHQLSLQEDQGIDMTQSPGRDSPGSSSGSAGSGSRHSSASLDSGRASGCPNATRCSLSSCSLSSDQTRLDRLLCQGLPDYDIIHAWLSELHFEEYSSLFATAGYDLPTITRMTPEDLTAIGIKKPNHRKRLKAEIANLNVPDNLPDYIPGSLDEWLRLLRLEEYGPVLKSQGYKTIQDCTQLAWEDLEEAGIVRLGHQKKFLLAIKRVKDVRAGKRAHTPHGHDLLLTPSPMSTGDLTPGSYVHTTLHAYQQPWEVQQSRSMISNYHQQQMQMLQKKHPGIPFSTTGSGNDLIPIQIRQPRGKSLESLEDGTERNTHLTFSPENTPNAYYCTHVNMNQQNVHTWRRSYDDGDITPTNEATILSSYEGGGTLPRPRGLVKPRPVAKISATTKAVRDNVIFQDVDEKSPKYIMEGFQNIYPIDKMGYPIQPQHTAQLRQMYTASPHMGKKMPPDPPKRQSSNPGVDQIDQMILPEQQYNQLYGPLRCFPNSYTQQSYVTTHQTTAEIHMEKIPSECSRVRAAPLSVPLSLPLPAYPSSDSLSSVALDSSGLPIGPPPPAPSSPLTQDDRRWTPINCPLAAQNRNGSDASFKSSSSTESDSLPFANENAGTIKQNRGSGQNSRPHTTDFGRSNTPLSALPPRHPSTPTHSANNNDSEEMSRSGAATPKASTHAPLSLPAEPGDVLNDIGNMLANLTDELDAMLEEEKRQGLSDN